MYQNSDKPTSTSEINLPLSVKRDNLLNSFKRNKKFKTNRKDSAVTQSKKFKNIFIITASVVILFLGFLLIKYINFSPIGYSGMDSLRLFNSDKRLTMLFIGLDDSNESYEYANSIVLMDIDFSLKLAKLYTIDPSFTTSMANGYPLRVLWNNYSKEERVFKMIENVELITGLKVDNYISYSGSYLNDILSNSNKTILAEKNLEIGLQNINKGDYIKLTSVANLILDQENLSNDLFYLQQLVLKRYFDDFKNKINIYNLFLNSEQFVNTFKTGLTKNDFIDFLFTLSDFEIYASDKYLMSSDLGIVEDRDLGAIKPIVNLVDQNIQNNFRDFEVIKEQVQIEVYNATKLTGLASSYQRMLQNRGSNVIKIGNFSELENKTVIYVDFKKIDSFQNTLNLISDLFETSVKMIDISEYKYNYSGDLILVIGEDN